MQIKLTAVYQRVPEGYIAYVEELPGANTQAVTLEEARVNLMAAIELVLEANRELDTCHAEGSEASPGATTGDTSLRSA